MIVDECWWWLTESLNHVSLFMRSYDLATPLYLSFRFFFFILLQLSVSNSWINYSFPSLPYQSCASTFLYEWLDWTLLTAGPIVALQMSHPAPLMAYISLVIPYPDTPGYYSILWRTEDHRLSWTIQSALRRVVIAFRNRKIFIACHDYSILSISPGKLYQDPDQWERIGPQLGRYCGERESTVQE